MSLNTMNSGQPQPQHNGNNRDIETVRRNYRSALSELTFNSKPIITNLTIMAQENQGAASIIVREIENQLRNNAPGQKLPVLYLIDSICKNVGGSFITNFARNMVSIFLDAYTLTDASVRKSFERLLQTWKNGMPGGNPVFPRHIIESIERSIVYIREKNPSRYPPPTSSHHNNHHHNNSSPSLHNNNNSISNNNNPNSGIHVNPNFINKEPRISARDPRNRSPQIIADKVPAQASTTSLISQLQAMLPSAQTQTLTTNDPVAQIISQIKAILPTLPATQASTIEQYLAQIAPPATIVTPSPTLSFSNTPPLTTTPATTTTTTIQPSPPKPQSSSVDTADLLKSLTSMGYLSPSPVIKPSPIIDDQSPISLNKFGPFLLDSKDLQIARPGAIELLYSAEPLQCKQCGFRYPKTDKGQAKMDAHLDSHFRQNRKMKERVKRGLSRSWFVTVEEWINGEGGELTSQHAPAFLHDGMGHVNNKSTEKSTQPSGEEAINPDHFTVIMPNDDNRKPCAICGERFIDFWNDDEEEWMYKNAIKVEDKIYHATCHADAMKSGNLIDSDSEMRDVNNSNKRKMEDSVGQASKIPRMA
ncbi:hypothetical protein MFLAVUS_008110 [Mucor flavus]|uniref:CID domain-containing protein n=1 Tax=Mucor flavus TaxID=439312 RepID=A0ABP9Z657_9FUNG